MLKVYKKEVRDRLIRSVRKSYETMDDFRQSRHKLIEQYVGHFYSERGTEYETIFNLINQTLRIIQAVFAANNPKVDVCSYSPEMFPTAKQFENALNVYIDDMELRTVFRENIADAFFGIGCNCVFMKDTDTRFHGMLESEENVWYDPGQPWIGRISMDDLILDMGARHIDKMRYCGHYYRADFEKVKKEPGYSKRVVKKLTPTKADVVYNYNPAKNIGSDQEDDDLKDMITLMDLWIPENGMVYTFAVGFDEPPLIEREWNGSQQGPYKFLSFGDVPDSPMPSSPGIQLKGLHDLVNESLSKEARQMRDQKTVHYYEPGGEDDARRVGDAADREWVKVQDVKRLGQMVQNGVDPNTIAFRMGLTDLFDRAAGNLRAMGGLGQQADTAEQEKIIQGAVSRIESDLMSAFTKFTSDCCRELGYLVHNSETTEIKASMEVVPGIEVDASWPPTDMYGNPEKGNFEDFRFKIVQHSTRYKDSQMKLAETWDFINRIAPLLPMFNAQGMTINMQELIEDIARLSDRPEYLRYIEPLTQIQQEAAQQQTGETRQSPITSREQVRRNVPTGGTMDSRSNILQQVFSGNSQANGDQLNSLTRSPV
jgi:hypothetical protein